MLEMEVVAAMSKGYRPQFTGPGGNVSAGAAASKRFLVVIGINTGFGQKARRDSIRQTWMPTGEGWGLRDWLAGVEGSVEQYGVRDLKSRDWDSRIETEV